MGKEHLILLYSLSLITLSKIMNCLQHKTIQKMLNHLKKRFLMKRIK